MGFLERSVTVNFTNQTSRTLFLTGNWQEDDSDYSHKPPPGEIQPGQSVQWKNAESDFVDCKGHADYKFTRIDNGQDGHLTISWSNPISSGNTYDVSCDAAPLYDISYNGGRGTNATINVTFSEKNAERSLTVNLTNQTTRTLQLIDLQYENDEGCDYTAPPQTIEPWQTVQWKNARFAIHGLGGSLTYKFSRTDNGQDGHLCLGWSNTVDGNSYDVSCDPTPLYGLMTDGGGGTSATMTLTFVERDLSLTYRTVQLELENDSGLFPYLAVGNNASDVVYEARPDNTRASGPADERAWAFVDADTGREAAFPFSDGQVVKIKSAESQRWLTAFSQDNNRIGLYPPHYADYPDQHWRVRVVSGGGGYLLENVKSWWNNLAIDGGKVCLTGGIAGYEPNQLWRVLS